MKRVTCPTCQGTFSVITCRTCLTTGWIEVSEDEERVDERSELQAEKDYEADLRKQALDETMRLLPKAESFAVFMVLPDGNIAPIVACTNFAHAIALSHIGGNAMRAHLGQFREGDTAEVG